MEINLSEDYEIISDLHKGSTNKIVYLIVIKGEDKDIYYVSSCVDLAPNFIEIKGYCIGKTSINSIKTYTDAVDAVNRDRAQIVSVLYPWHKIDSITNVSYRIK